LFHPANGGTKDLIKETARLFGYSRIGANVETAMHLVISKALEKGYGFIENGRVILKEAEIKKSL